MCASSSSSSAAEAMLKDIAKALGTSVESFFGTNTQSYTLAMTNEMLSLWLSIKSDESRAVILEIVRAAVAEHTS
jgi:hypothetical protein